jgi:hypothetical protein
MLDMIAVPERLEGAVGKAQHQNILRRFFAEKMIAPIGLIFGSLPRGGVLAKRPFDDHAPPRLLRLLDRPDVAELFDRRTKEPVRDCQIK